MITSISKVSASPALPDPPIDGGLHLCSPPGEAIPECYSENPGLDHRDSAILKGLAIAAIVFHNFFHFVSPARQNEFSFDPARFPVFLATVIHPALAVQALFSFFGHFGVQIFIFLSAYGLSKSHWDDSDSWLAFMRGRIGKLYPAFAIVVIPWWIALVLRFGSPEVIARTLLELILMLLGLSTLMGYGLPPVGPWWFIPFIVQFYALWPFMRRLTIKWGWPALLLLAVVCLAVTYIANPVLAHWSINLFQTPIGRMPVLCLGILAARYPVRISAPLAFLSGAVLLLGCRYGLVWPLTFPAALLVALWIYMKLRVRLRNYSFLVRIGEYSLLIFLFNGIVRDRFVVLATSPASQLLFGCVSAAVSFTLAAIIHEWFTWRRASSNQLSAA